MKYLTLEDVSKQSNTQSIQQETTTETFKFTGPPGNWKCEFPYVVDSHIIVNAFKNGILGFANYSMFAGFCVVDMTAESIEYKDGDVLELTILQMYTKTIKQETAK